MPTLDPQIFVRQDFFFNQGDYAQAIVNFNQALSMKADDPAVFYQRGLAYEALGECDAAVADYSTTIQLAADHQDAYTRRGVLYLNCINDLDLALADFNRLVELYPAACGATFTGGKFLPANPIGIRP